MSSRTAKDTQRNPVSKKQKLKIKIKEMEFKIKPCKDGKCTENMDMYVIVLSLNCLTTEKETAAKRHLIINVAWLV